MSIFSKEPEEEVNIGDYAELPEETDKTKIKIKIEKLEKFSDSDTIIRSVREGNIVFAAIKSLNEENKDELKHTLSKIKTCCATIDGNIVGVANEWVIVSPKNAKIQK